MTYLLVLSIFYGIPVILLIFFFVCLYRFLSARKKNKINPGSFSDESMKLRKILLIISSIMLACLVIVVVAFIAILSSAVAYM